MAGALPTSAEWLEVWNKKGGEGGMLAEEVDWETYKRTTREGRPPPPRMEDVNIVGAQRDVEELKWYVKRAPKRRAAPLGSPPVELTLMLLFPNRRRDLRLGGVGFALAKIELQAGLSLSGRCICYNAKGPGGTAFLAF